MGRPPTGPGDCILAGASRRPPRSRRPAKAPTGDVGSMHISAFIRCLRQENQEISFHAAGREAGFMTGYYGHHSVQTAGSAPASRSPAVRHRRFHCPDQVYLMRPLLCPTGHDGAEHGANKARRSRIDYRRGFRWQVYLCRFGLPVATTAARASCSACSVPARPGIRDQKLNPVRNHTRP